MESEVDKEGRKNLPLKQDMLPLMESENPAKEERKNLSLQCMLFSISPEETDGEEQKNLALEQENQAWKEPDKNKGGTKEPTPVIRKAPNAISDTDSIISSRTAKECGTTGKENVASV